MLFTFLPENIGTVEMLHVTDTTFKHLDFTALICYCSGLMSHQL